MFFKVSKQRCVHHSFDKVNKDLNPTTWGDLIHALTLDHI